jgi:YD repeat-containing protein
MDEAALYIMKNISLISFLFLFTQSSVGSEQKCEVLSEDRVRKNDTYTAFPLTGEVQFQFNREDLGVISTLPISGDASGAPRMRGKITEQVSEFARETFFGLSKETSFDALNSYAGTIDTYYRGYEIIDVMVNPLTYINKNPVEYKHRIVATIRKYSNYPSGIEAGGSSVYEIGSFIYTIQKNGSCKSGYTPDGDWCVITKSDYVECPKEPREEKAKGEPRSCRSLVGNPINLESGAKYLKEEYPQFKGFDFYFTYSGPMVGSNETQANGAEGEWTNSYQRRMKVALNSVGEPEEGGNYLELHQADGKVLVFINKDEGIVPLDADVVERVEFDSANSQWIVLKKNNETESYDSSGRLVSITNRIGERRTLDYDEQTHTATVSSLATGRVLTLQYSSSDFSQLTAVTGPLGHLYQYQYAVNGMLQQVTYPSTSDGRSSLIYHYDAQYGTRLTSITDEAEVNYTRWGYDAYGRANLSEKGKEGQGISKESLDYTYINDSYSPRIVITNALGKKTIYHYKVLQGTRKLVHLEGEALGTCAASDSYYSYDDFGFERTVTDNKAYVAETIRNSRGLVEEMRNALTWSNGVNTDLVETADTQKIVTEWHDVLSLPKSRIYYSKDESNVLQAYKREDWTYTPENRISEITMTDLTTYFEPYSTNGRTKVVTHQYEYHDADNTLLKTHTVNGPLDPNAQNDGVDDITVSHFDEVGQLTEVINAYGHSTVYSEYDAAGNALKITDPNGVVRRMSYTPRGWLKSTTVETAKGNSVTQYEYYPNGMLEKTIYADGSFISYEYDEARHISAIANNFGERIEYPDRSLLDGKWLTGIVKDGSGDVVRQSERVFDEMGRLKKVLGNSGQETEFKYDLNNNIVFDNKAGYEDSVGSGGAEILQTQHGYDGLNRKTSTLDALGNTANIKYDVNGSVLSVIDPNGNKTSYIYDGFGQLIQTESPDTGTTSFYYDKAGNTTGIHNAKGVHFNQAFDALSRPLVRSQNLTTDDIDWVYDDEQAKAVGRLYQLIDTTGINQYTYDEFGNIAVHSQELQVGDSGSVSVNTTYGYNLRGSLASIQYPGGRTVNYNSIRGRVSGVNSDQGSILSSVQYEPFGSIGTLSYSNGVVQTTNFDIDGRLSELAVVQSNNDIFRLSYRFDSFNNIVGIDSSTSKEANQSFAYDKVHRLREAAGQYGAVSYGYDPVGNRLSRNITRDEYTKAETYHYPWANNRVEGMTVVENDKTTERNFSYDELGNITSDEKPVLSKELIYNEEGRLESVRYKD